MPSNTSISINDIYETIYTEFEMAVGQQLTQQALSVLTNNITASISNKLFKTQYASVLFIPILEMSDEGKVTLKDIRIETVEY